MTIKCGFETQIYRRNCNEIVVWILNFYFKITFKLQINNSCSYDLKKQEIH